MGNLEKMGRFLENFNFPGLNQEEIMNKPITSTEIKTVIKNLKIKSPGPDGFMSEFYQTYRDKRIPIPLKSFQKSAEKGKPKLIP